MVDDGTHPLWDRNEVHEIYREWRRVFDRYNPPRSAVPRRGCCPSASISTRAQRAWPDIQL
ncbi:MAG: hypothetical protein ACLTYW_04830 [Collinsella sp.]